MQHFQKSAVYCGAILTLILCPIASAALAQANETKAEVKSETRNDKLPACLGEISRATMLEDATLRSGTMRANISAAQKLGNAAHDELVGLLKSATPAGRVISLCLLQKLEPGHFAQYVEQVRADSGDSSVSYISASERCHYTVNDILNDLASARPSIKVVY